MAKFQRRYNLKFGALVFTLGTGLVLFGYAAVQQTIRIGANIAPAMIAAPLALRTVPTADLRSLVGPTVPGFGEGNYPTVIIYDHALNPIATNIAGFTDMPNQLPWRPPVGTFAYNTTRQLDHRFTWQPTNGSRLATVLARSPGNGGYYVVAASNLTEPEALIERTAYLAIATVIGVVILAVLAALYA
jgi:hypothetical protein